MIKRTSGTSVPSMGGKDFSKAQSSMQGMMGMYADLGEDASQKKPPAPAKAPIIPKSSSKPKAIDKTIVKPAPVTIGGIKSPLGSTKNNPSPNPFVGQMKPSLHNPSPIVSGNNSLKGTRGSMTELSMAALVQEMKKTLKPLPNTSTIIAQRKVLDKPGLHLYDFSEEGVVNEIITDTAVNSQYTLAKASELFENPTISWNISPSNLKQGNVGDCYILGSLSVVANHSDNIKRLMEDKQGDVEVWLCDSGCWKLIRMNKTFPVQNNRIMFATPKDNCIWQMVIEKAFACMYKGYDRLELGHSSVAMGELTGCATEYIELDNPAEAWANIVSFLQKKLVITASSKVSGLSSQTITPKHCYAVLDAQEVTYQGKKIKFVKLMNPMSLWAEPPPLPAEIAKQLSSQSHDIFWYQFSSVLKDFEVLTCCKIKSELTYSWSRVKNPGQQQNMSVFRLLGSQGDKLNISLNHKNLRHYIKQSLDSIMKTKYAVTRVIAFSFNNKGGIEVLGYGFHSLHSVRMELDLEDAITSEIFLFVDIDYAQPHTDEYTLSASGSHPIVFQRESEMESFLAIGNNKANFIKLLLLQTALNGQGMQVSKHIPLKFTLHEYNHKVKGPQPALLRYYGQALGYVAFIYCNGTNNCTLKESYSPAEMKNVVEYLPRGIKLKDYSLVLEPGQREVVVLKFGPENNCSHVSRIGTTSELHF